jgi:Holliday junction resolvase-like predicted endonuclease
MADSDKSPEKGISHDEVVRILKKRLKKTAGDLDLIDENFESVKFFQEYKQKLDTENFQKLLKQLEYEKI